MLSFRSLTDCRLCGEPTAPVFEFDHPMPLAGGFETTRELALASPRLPLTWRWCQSCSLIQVEQDVPDSVLYSRYNYASSSVAGLRLHFGLLANKMRATYPEPHLRLLEIGCNDGVLLNRLPSSWSLVGVDPSDVALGAPHPSYELVNEPFTAELVREREWTGQFDIITSSNTLAHMTDIPDVLNGAQLALRDGGHLWVEVHDLERTLAGQWDTIYHEHKVEWSIVSLIIVLGRHGFNFMEASPLPLHGGLIRARFQKARDERAQGRWVSPDFNRLLTAYRNRRAVYAARVTDTPDIAYGAAGRATVWFNQMPGIEFEAVIDDSPLRAGKFVPGTGYPIVSWGARPESNACLITAWNYADQIESAHPEYGGHWIRTFEA